MHRFVALLRGINVGKAKRLAMADLRALLVSLGYQQVRTLLNSGNAVFDATVDTPPPQHAARIQAAIADELGVDCLVIVKSAAEIAAALAENPLAAGANDPSNFLLAFTIDAPSLQALSSLAGKDLGAEKLHVGEHAAYLWCANGILASQVAESLLKMLSKSGTTRNWATVEKIHGLLGRVE
ncbi:DUF1697 domain-containing protein [Chitinimonas arctica]|uniref:DUF1697 domain-containing protein n=1 Tax=Chitinimonas arctica TaxID=2594795 RepID=A0A516SKQ9_9NEIS|nr:DUF1697 domain-containing protein [Chitinimonas arctica]QDQ28703.1 DUF1697 domain-containing protein [Chitinimonas arctica]